jgi:hypothetical protein
MKTLPLNDNLIRILKASANAISATVSGLEQDERFTSQNEVGRIVQAAAEQGYQDIAVLKDIVARYKDSK